VEAPDGLILVLSDADSLDETSALIRFNPALADRAILGRPPDLQDAPQFSTALCFVFAEGGRICLFELASTD
jgi:hypothetical protein